MHGTTIKTYSTSCSVNNMHTTKTHCLQHETDSPHTHTQSFEEQHNKHSVQTE